MSETNLAPRYRQKLITARTKAVKAARILKGLSRKEAGRLCGCSAKAFEQIENGRCNFTEERLQKILKGLAYSPQEFAQLEFNPDEALARAKPIARCARSIERRPRRSCFRLITKEVRVLRVLRLRKGISQDQASLLCGYTRAIFGQIENGRINIPRPRIEHIVRSLGYTVFDFDRLYQTEVLRDEVLENCRKHLDGLDDQALASAQTVLKALGGAVV